MDNDLNKSNASDPHKIKRSEEIKEVPPRIKAIPKEDPTKSPADANEDLKPKQQDAKIPLESSRIPFWDETQGILQKIEKEFDSRAILFYVARDSSLTEEEVSELYNHLKRVGKQKKLSLVVYGPGGSGIAAYRIVNLLRRFTEELVVIVPELAASAMTMLSLGADKILMGPVSTLSPIDTSIARNPLAPTDKEGRPVSVEITQVKKYLELVNSKAFNEADDFRKTPYYALTEKVHPVFLGTVQRSLSLSKKLLKGIIKTHINDEEQIERIVNKLNDDFPVHSYPILKRDLLSFKLNVEDMTEIQEALTMDLISIYMTLSKGGVNVKEGVRSTIRRYSIIESMGFRSYYLFMAKDKLVKDSKWINISKRGVFERAAVTKNKRGYYEVRALDLKQFRDWIQGKEIEVE